MDLHSLASSALMALAAALAVSLAAAPAAAQYRGGYSRSYSAPKAPSYSPPPASVKPPRAQPASPRYNAPRYDAPRNDTQRYDAPRYEAPRYEAPRYEAPRYEAQRPNGSPSTYAAPEHTRAQPSHVYQPRESRGQGSDTLTERSGGGFGVETLRRAQQAQRERRGGSARQRGVWTADRGAGSAGQAGKPASYPYQHKPELRSSRGFSERVGNVAREARDLRDGLNPGQYGRDERRWREERRHWRRDDWRWGWNGRPGWDHRDFRHWDFGWRNDPRFDWFGFRRHNRFLFRPGPYFAPFGGHRYNLLRPGFFLDSLFFQPRFFINDPFAFRLPPAHGPYQWVRYYDDVLLVDIVTGEVVEVIRGFFR